MTLGTQFSMKGNYIWLIVLAFSGTPCGHSADSQAFIFSLYSTMGYHPVKLTQTGKHASKAVYICKRSLLSFGNGGQDLYIDYPTSHTKPHAYLPLPGCSLNAQCTVFAGSYDFTPSDVEVFYLVAS